MNAHVMGDGDWEAYYAKRKPVTREEFEQLSLKIGSLEQLSLKIGSLEQLSLKIGSLEQLSLRIGSLEQQYSAIMQGMAEVNASIEALSQSLYGGW